MTYRFLDFTACYMFYYIVIQMRNQSTSDCSRFLVAKLLNKIILCKYLAYI